MKNHLHTVLCVLGMLLGSYAFAQPLPPYNISVTGQVVGCLPNSSVYIETTEMNQLVTLIEVPMNSDCSYGAQVEVQTLTPTILVYTPCTGANNSDTIFVSIDPAFPDSTTIMVNLNCSGNEVTDCEGVVNGPAMPGTACTTAGGQPGIYTTNCFCEEILNCNACFTVDPVVTPTGNVPFTLSTTNCSTGGVAPYAFVYDFGDGVTSTGEDTVHEYSIAGIYMLCLTITDASGCTNTVCDSVVVDANGNINPMSNTVDCLGIVNGPNSPGSPCELGMNDLGTWDMNCICQPDSSTAICMAEYMVIQAFTNADSTNGNPGGGTEPIPNEVWVWNQSTGTGNLQYFWNFGDGTSSTEAYPTHVYANGGPYVLCLTMSDDANCTSTYCDTLSIDDNGLLNGMIGHNDERAGFTMNVIQQLPTTINEQEHFFELALWPNPVSDAFTLTMNSTTSGRFDVSILDMNGRLLSTNTSAVNTGKNILTIPVSDLESGLYVVRISDGKNTTSRRFVKQ